MTSRRATGLALCVLFVILSYTHALTVSFSESDLSVTESDREARVIVTKGQRNRGNVTCTLIPLSVDEARILYGYDELSQQVDPAESGLDFDSTPMELVFEPSLGTMDGELFIEVLDDDVFEGEELFLIRLNVSVSDPRDEDMLMVGIQYLKIQISGDASDEVSLEAVSSQSVSEGDGLVEDFITISKDGKSELPLSFTIGVAQDGQTTAQQGIDYELMTGEFTIQPNESNVTLSLLVIDDEVAEGIQSFTWTLSQAQTEAFVVSITDNDVVTVRMTNESETVVGEGGTITVCADIEAPVDIDRQLFVVGSLVPGTAQASSDYVPVSNVIYRLSGSMRRSCNNISTINDDIPETTEQFALSLQRTFPEDPLIRVEPDNINFTLNDDDIPQVQVTLPGNASVSDGVTLTEGDSDSVTISILEPNFDPVLISVTVVTGSAESDEDFVIEVGNFTLTPGNSSLVLPLSIPDDDYVENDKQFRLLVSQPGSVHPPLIISFTIIDNDRVTVGFVNDSVVSVGEGEVVTVCGKLVDVPPSLLQREIALEGQTVPGTAEEGSDFEAVAWNFTFSPTAPDLLCVEIAIINDDTPELKEAFSVTIALVMQPDPQVSVQPSTVDISIENDDVPQLEVEVVGSQMSGNRYTIREDDGELNDLIKIFSTGVHPFPIEYHVSVIPSSGDDVMVEVGTFVFSPTDDEHFLPVTVIEDEIAEEEEEVTVVITVPGNQPPHIISLTVLDNDDLRVGFLNDSEVLVEEGQTVTLCAGVISPEEVDRSIVLLARTIPITAVAEVDYSPVTVGLSLSGSQRSACTDITTFENDTPQHPREFRVRLEVRGQPGPHSFKLSREEVRVKMIDNDGIPLAPVITDVKLLESESNSDKSYNLTFSWEAERSELRPIDTFSGSVILNSKRETRTSLPHNGRRLGSRDEVGLPETYSFTVDGSTTEYTVVDIQLVEEYIVQVCSRNTLGFNCSTPSAYLPGLVVPSEGGVADGDDDRLPAGVIVSIVLLVVFLVIFCCLCFICLLLCCCWPSVWRSYHPKRKEKRHEKEFKSYRERYSWQAEIDSDFDSDLGEDV